MSRGKVTTEIQELAREQLGLSDFGKTELRLMPYIQYVMMNEQRIDPNRINADERKVLAQWREDGFIEGGASGLAITKEFWDAMSEILWLGYVVGAADTTQGE